MVFWEKSALYGDNMDEEDLQSMAEKLNCKTVSSSFIYLGLLLGLPEASSFLATSDWPNPQETWQMEEV